MRRDTKTGTPDFYTFARDYLHTYMPTIRGLLLTVVDPADDGFVEDADRNRRFGRQADGLVGDVTVVRQARPRVSSAW
jgi:hypothetical protein